MRRDLPLAIIDIDQGHVMKVPSLGPIHLEASALVRLDYIDGQIWFADADCGAGICGKLLRAIEARADFEVRDAFISSHSTAFTDDSELVELRATWIASSVRARHSDFWNGLEATLLPTNNK